MLNDSDDKFLTTVAVPEWLLPNFNAYINKAVEFLTTTPIPKAALELSQAPDIRFIDAEALRNEGGKHAQTVSMPASARPLIDSIIEESQRLCMETRLHYEANGIPLPISSFDNPVPLTNMRDTLIRAVLNVGFAGLDSAQDELFKSLFVMKKNLFVEQVKKGGVAHLRKPQRDYIDRWLPASKAVPPVKKSKLLQTGHDMVTSEHARAALRAKGKPTGLAQVADLQRYALMLIGVSNLLPHIADAQDHDPSPTAPTHLGTIFAWLAADQTGARIAALAAQIRARSTPTQETPTEQSSPQ